MNKTYPKMNWKPNSSNPGPKPYQNFSRAAMPYIHHTIQEESETGNKIVETPSFLKASSRKPSPFSKQALMSSETSRSHLDPPSSRKDRHRISGTSMEELGQFQPSQLLRQTSIISKKHKYSNSMSQIGPYIPQLANNYGQPSSIMRTSMHNSPSNRLRHKRKASMFMMAKSLESPRYKDADNKSVLINALSKSEDTQAGFKLNNLTQILMSKRFSKLSDYFKNLIIDLYNYARKLETFNIGLSHEIKRLGGINHHLYLAQKFKENMLSALTEENRVLETRRTNLEDKVNDLERDIKRRTYAENAMLTAKRFKNLHSRHYSVMTFSMNGDQRHSLMSRGRGLSMFSVNKFINEKANFTLEPTVEKKAKRKNVGTRKVKSNKKKKGELSEEKLPNYLKKKGVRDVSRKNMGARKLRNELFPQFNRIKKMNKQKSGSLSIRGSDAGNLSNRASTRRPNALVKQHSSILSSRGGTKSRRNMNDSIASSNFAKSKSKDNKKSAISKFSKYSKKNLNDHIPKSSGVENESLIVIQDDKTLPSLIFKRIELSETITTERFELLDQVLSDNNESFSFFRRLTDRESSLGEFIKGSGSIGIAKIQGSLKSLLVRFRQFC